MQFKFDNQSQELKEHQGMLQKRDSQQYIEGQEYLEDPNNEQSRHMPRSIFEQEINTQSMVDDLSRRPRRISKQMMKASEKLPPAPHLKQSSLHQMNSSANAALKMQGKIMKRKHNDSQVVSDENNSNEPNANSRIKQEINQKETNTVYQKYSIRNKLETTK